MFVKGEKMKNRSGFSLLELIITVVIIAILSLVTIVVYKGYRQRAIDTEARMMLGELNKAQQVYYLRHKSYTSNADSLKVDLKRNKYFTTFTITNVN